MKLAVITILSSLVINYIVVIRGVNKLMKEMEIIGIKHSQEMVESTVIEVKKYLSTRR